LAIIRESDKRRAGLLPGTSGTLSTWWGGSSDARGGSTILGSSYDLQDEGEG
jgi:hypothetical protein